MNSKEQDPSIQSLRGLAILLVVFFHFLPTREVGSVNFYTFLNESFKYIRLPLFTLISGYIYAMYPVTSMNTGGTFLIKKFKRVMIPFIILTVSTMSLRSMHGIWIHNVVEKNEIFLSLLYPIIPYWFLISIFTCFILVAILDANKFLENVRTSVFVLVISLIILSTTYYTTNIFALNKTITLFPFFIFGLILHRFKKIIIINKYNFYLFLIFLVFFLIFELSIFGGQKIDSSLYLFRLITSMYGMLFCYVLVVYKDKIYTNFLAFFGLYAYPIFLLHLIGSGVAVRIAEVLQLENVNGIFIMRFTFALILPIVFYEMTRNIKLIRVLVFGEK